MIRRYRRSIAATILIALSISFLGAGIFLQSQLKDPINNFALLNRWTPAEKTSEQTLSDLLVIWKTLVDADDEFSVQVHGSSLLYQAQEGFLVRRRAAERLAPVLRGALQARNLSLCDYLLLEERAETCLRAIPEVLGKDSGIDHFCLVVIMPALRK